MQSLRAQYSVGANVGPELTNVMKMYRSARQRIKPQSGRGPRYGNTALAFHRHGLPLQSLHRAKIRRTGHHAFRFG